MAGQTPFARAYLPWVAEWSRAGLTGTQERVMLMLVSRMRPVGGSWASSYPRGAMARHLGLSERTVESAIRALKAKGMIEMRGAAGPGRTAEYALMPGAEKGGMVLTRRVANGTDSESTHKNRDQEVAPPETRYRDAGEWFRSHLSHPSPDGAGGPVPSGDSPHDDDDQPELYLGGSHDRGQGSPEGD